jgi:hypothetical protein
MKIETKSNIDWNKAPFNMDNKVSKEVRQGIYNRLVEVLLVNLRDETEYNKLLLKDGWVITAKDNVVFVINPIKDEDLPNNANLKEETFNSNALRAKFRKLSDKIWDCEKYSDLAKIAGLTLDQNTGKITLKVV